MTRVFDKDEISLLYNIDFDVGTIRRIKTDEPVSTAENRALDAAQWCIDTYNEGKDIPDNYEFSSDAVGDVWHEVAENMVPDYYSQLKAVFYFADVSKSQEEAIDDYINTFQDGYGVSLDIIQVMTFGVYSLAYELVVKGYDDSGRKYESDSPTVGYMRRRLIEEAEAEEGYELKRELEMKDSEIDTRYLTPESLDAASDEEIREIYKEWRR